MADESDALELKQGATVSRYVILGPAGSGGMGVVYAAYDPELDRKVALKFLRAEYADSDGRTRMLREAQAMARLSHPNVVAVHDVGTHGPRVFLAMDFVEGVTLHDWLERTPRPSWREILSLFVQAGQGLAAAHAAGVVHRDFKHSNVVVDAEGRARVLDFGLARAVGEESAIQQREWIESGGSGDDVTAKLMPLGSPLTATGAVMGTPAYISPEQFHGEPADARSDQFSFCVALWEALYGRHPFGEAESNVELMKRIRDGRLDASQSGGAGVPAYVRRALLRGLSSDPAARFATMDELLRALTRDPSANLKRGALIALVVAAPLITSLVVMQRQRAQSRLCAGAEARLSAIWDASRKAAVRQALLGTNRPYAAFAAARVQEALDARAREWVAMRTEACEATRIRGEQSEELMDLRVACLDDRLEEMEALTSIFLKSPAESVEHAIAAVRELTPVQTCGRADSLLLTPVRAPSDPATRQKLQAVSSRLAEARALGSTGRYKDAIAPAEAAVKEARAAGHPPTLARALYELGALRGDAGQFADAERELTEAVWAAEAGRFDEGVIGASIELVEVVGYNLERPADAQRWAELAEAKIARMGAARNELRAELKSTLGTVTMTQGDYALAEKQLAEALRLYEQTFGPNDVRLAAPLSALGHVHFSRGEGAAALARLQRALELRQKEYGPDHPQIALSLNNVGAALFTVGRVPEAIDHFTRSLAIRERLLGPDHPMVATTLNNVAELERLLRRYDSSLEHHRRALAILEKALGPDHPRVAESLDGLGALRRATGHAREALEHHRRALQIRERAHGRKHPRRSYSLTGIGRALIELRQPAQAIAPLHEALRLREASAAEPGDLSETRFALARALWESGSDRSRAIVLAKQARDGYAPLGSAYAPDLAEVDAWLRGKA